MIRYASVAVSSLAYSSLFVVAVAVEHRPAGVEQDVADEVGLLLVLLDGVAFGAAVALPVDVADVVAGDVLAVLHELDGEAAERALVVADAQALDDGAGLQAQSLGAGEDVGLQVAWPCRRLSCRLRVAVESDVGNSHTLLTGNAFRRPDVLRHRLAAAA